jgi:4-nitrophenyl phosphatase
MMKDHNFSGIRALILDMDGVLWRQNQPIGDLPTIFNRIKNNHLKVTLATNNASLSIKQYQEKLNKFGVTLSDEEIINSSQVMAHYLDRQYPNGGTLYIVGENGLRETLTKNNFALGEEHVQAVIVGMDREINYEKLCRATLLIRSGAAFLATNADVTFPTPQGLVPGVGAILACIETATSVKPYVVGKPAPAIYEIAMQRMGVKPEETLVVGDRLETDIAGAQTLGCLTALVLSGVTDPTAAQKWTPAPDLIAQDLTSVLDELI